MTAGTLRLTVVVLVGLLIVFAGVRSPHPAEATFHIAHINEAMFGVNGDANLQFVEIAMEAPGQNLVHNTRLSAWNADGSFFGVLLLVPSDLPSASQARWIMGTPDLFAATGLKPDFTFPVAALSTTGMVCWGAPGAITPDPSTWDPSNPLNYVDCLPYGGYSATNIRNAPATTLGLGDGNLSLTRISTSAPPNTSTDFALRCATPENDAMQVRQAGPDSDQDGWVDCSETSIGKSPATYCAIMRADVDEDGSVTILDLSQVATRYLQTIPPAPARFDQFPPGPQRDNVLTILDLSAMAANYLKLVTQCP